MNSVTSVGASNQNYQMAFRAKGNQEVYKVIDNINDITVDFLNKNRPLEEQKEIAIRKSLKFLKDLKIKDLFVGKKVKPNETTVEHLTQRDVILDYFDNKYYIDKAVADGMMDPEKAKNLLANKGIELAYRRVAGMSTWEMLKEIAKNMFKKS